MATLPRPAGSPPRPTTPEELVVVLPEKKGKRKAHVRFQDVEQRPARLTEATLERGEPHLRLENPAVWSGSICPDEDED